MLELRFSKSLVLQSGRKSRNIDQLQSLSQYACQIFDGNRQNNLNRIFIAEPVEIDRRELYG